MTPHSAQKRVIIESRRYNVLACGRRWGKTVLGIERLIRRAREGYPVAWFGPTYKMMADVWRDVVRATQDEAERVSAMGHRVELKGGGVLELWSLETNDPARGRKYARVVIDEAAMVPALGDVWQIVIRPTLTDYKGDAWFLSTPRGRNFFWQMYQSGLDPLQKEWACWQMPTTANPYIDPNEVEAARQELPERVFQQEYLAQFLDDGGGVFRKVRDAAKAKRAQPYAGRFVMGADWGMQTDFTVLTVMDVKARRVVDIDRFNRIDWEFQRGRLRSMADKWKVAAIYAEHNSFGGPNIEALQREGLPVIAFETTATTKPPLIESLALGFERGEIEILDDPVLIGELEAYERQVSETTGRSRYNAPAGVHDDCVMSLALAWYGVVNNYGGQLFW